MIPTPDLSHLNTEDYQQVYEPAEDTFILLDALEQDEDGLQAMKAHVKNPREQAQARDAYLHLCQRFWALPTLVLYLCTDINAHATRCTLGTGRQNNVELQPILAFLARPILERLQHRVDVLIFNPPYVPTPRDELGMAQKDKGIAGSWAGGADGMQLTNELLECVGHLLAPQGRFYLVALKANGIENIQARMLNEFGLVSKVCLQRRAGREHLFVLRFQRQS